MVSCVLLVIVIDHNPRHPLVSWAQRISLDSNLMLELVTLRTLSAIEKSTSLALTAFIGDLGQVMIVLLEIFLNTDHEIEHRHFVIDHVDGACFQGVELAFERSVLAGELPSAVG